MTWNDDSSDYIAPELHWTKLRTLKWKTIFWLTDTWLPAGLFAHRLVHHQPAGDNCTRCWDEMR